MTQSTREQGRRGESEKEKERNRVCESESECVRVE